MEVFQVIPSTNAYALAHPPEKADHWYLYAAEQQTAGRGRLGRVWQSPAFENIYLSLSWRVVLDSLQRQRLSALSLVIGLSVIDVLRVHVPQVHWQLKWPNDVWGNGRKVAGILLESQSMGTCIHLVVGLGLNVYSKVWPALDPQPTSLALLTQGVFDRSLLVADIVSRWSYDIDQFLSEGLVPFQSRWANVDALLGKSITLTTAQGQVEGVACGIDAQGALQLRHAIGGQILSHSVGEVQLLKTGTSV